LGYHKDVLDYDHWGSTPLVNKLWFISPGLTLSMTSPTNDMGPYNKLMLMMFDFWASAPFLVGFML
jgi:hypothetical protein